MRYMPLDNHEWVLNHVQVFCSGEDIIVEFKDLTMIHNDVNHWHSRNLNYIKTTYNRFIVFKDKYTNEFFKLKSSNWRGVVEMLLRLPEINKRLCVPPNFDIIIRGYDTREKYLIDIAIDDTEDYRDQYINIFFKYKNIDRRKVNESVFANYYSWIKQFLPKNASSAYLSTGLRSCLSEATKNDDIFALEDLEQDFCLANNTDKYSKSVMDILQKHSDDFYIKYLLLNDSNYFTGRYKVLRHRYNGNKNPNTFDMVDIELHMISDRKKAIYFIKNNMKEIKRLLKLIIYNNSWSKKYANYMKLDSLRLSPDNVLIAKFIFKDKLEKLLQEEN